MRKYPWLMIVAFGFGASALAQSPSTPIPVSTDAPPHQPAKPLGSTVGTTFGSYDADSNGAISPREASTDSGLASQFYALDANRDRALDQGEFAKFEASAGAGAAAKPAAR